MAALTERIHRASEIVDLRQLTGRELNPLLLEEAVEWQEQLDWDFSRSAELVRQYTDMKALNGFALLDRGEVAGYGYSVLEDHKGLIGDIYLRPRWRQSDAALDLFRATVNGLLEIPEVRRIESQLMLTDIALGRALEREGPMRLFDRTLMSVESSGAELLAAGKAAMRFYMEPWAGHHSEGVAEVIALAYQDHVDAQINDQYRSLPGARRFIYNIVQYPGCGTFSREGSLVAFDLKTGLMAGAVLASFVGPAAGHITQLCVTPRARGMGLGYELLRHSILRLRQAGAKRVSLTVTCGNEEAIELYRRCGFGEVRRFLAYVWEKDGTRPGGFAR